MMRRATLSRALLVVGLAALCSWPALAGNWPRFRGPNGTGVAADNDIPLRWSATENVLWKTAIPGVGHSSPVVWGERLFVQSASADAQSRSLLCLNAADGKVLWTRAVPGTVPNHKVRQESSLASATPATDGQRVYALFWDGSHEVLHAYDFDGRPQWQQDLGTFTSQHGAGTSPMVWRDKVIVANDQDGTSTLVAFDAASGKPAWEAPRKAFRACYSVPFVLEKDGGPPQLIVGSTAGVTSYDPQTGRENWSWNWQFTRMPLRTVASPVYSQGLVFLNSGDGGGDRHLVAVKAEGRGDVSKTNLAWEWRKTRPFPYVPTLLPYGEHVYFVNDRGDAGCFVARTGEIVWTEHLGSANVFASPILVGDKVYAVGEDGTGYVFAAAPTFQLLATNPLGEEVKATPAVADHRLFLRGKEHLFCIANPPRR